ncbi:Crp/Fnr family transcriptional regulator [Thiorhodospira sibirica]|uniref:Crp/Fnr family transcriptional regulator n=1 Tax=Thiorhodospira sibirica TaxID=154347 RepID=UPI00022C0BAB|nr:cyclic nucleotide-binding domain-containing protein [Thiorhodospira sibirica]
MDHTSDDIKSFCSSRLGEGLNEEQMRLLASISRCRTLHDDEILFEEGKVDHTLHIVASGKLLITRQVAGGDPLILHVIQEGDLAGEMSFVGGRPHSATVRAIGRPTVCTFERSDFESLIEKDPWLVYKVMQNIVKVVHDILRKMNTQYVEMSNYISQQHGRY